MVTPASRTTAVLLVFLNLTSFKRDHMVFGLRFFKRDHMVTLG